MCKECSIDKVAALAGTLRQVVTELDVENEHAAAALVAQAIDLIENKLTNR